ncbi:hypothetical protein DFH11DRAFT_1510041, partial [Phellopilus nigrolimitatus]
MSPVHALVQVWKIRGGQYKYAGHCVNFARDVETLHQRVPLLPEDCDIIILRRSGMDDTINQEIHNEFRVRRSVIKEWLQAFEQYHPSFAVQNLDGTPRQPQVSIDYSLLDNLPEDGSVFDRLQTTVQDMPADFAEEQGPPEENTENDEAGAPLFTAGLVPNMHNGLSEMDELREAAGPPPPVILTMPEVRSTPVNEHAGLNIAVDAFPCLFLKGMAGYDQTRDKPVSMEGWAAHLLRFKDKRFAQHPRFRYWALNTVMRHK